VIYIWQKQEMQGDYGPRLISFNWSLHSQFGSGSFRTPGRIYKTFFHDSLCIWLGTLQSFRMYLFTLVSLTRRRNLRTWEKRKKT